jgi:hypothetical protein
VTCLTGVRSYWATVVEYMDTLTTPVLLHCMATNSRMASVGCIATNSREARFSIGPPQCYIKKATESRVS